MRKVSARLAVSAVLLGSFLAMSCLSLPAAVGSPASQALQAAELPAATQLPGTAPICAHPSHDRVVVRPGRDVCAASLNAAGRPMAMGFLPTRCEQRSDEYVIDAAGIEDRCFAPIPKTPAEANTR